MFQFSCGSVDIFKETKRLGTLKAIKINDIPVKILKQNADIFPDNICNIFSFCVNETISKYR